MVLTNPHCCLFWRRNKVNSLAQIVHCKYLLDFSEQPPGSNLTYPSYRRCLIVLNYCLLWKYWKTKLSLCLTVSPLLNGISKAKCPLVNRKFGVDFSEFRLT